MVTMSLPDFVMILVIFGFGAFGFAIGLIQVVGGLVGVVAAAWAGAYFYQPIGAKLAPYFMDNTTTAMVVAFIAIFLIVNGVVGLGFHILNRIFNILSFIPFLKSLNRLAGGLLGLLEGALLLGIVLQFASQLSPLPWVNLLVENSIIAKWLLAFIDQLAPFLPKLLESAPSAPPLPYGAEVI